MRFEEPTGRRAEVALELLLEGRPITYRSLSLELAPSGELECSVWVESHPEAVDAATAEHKCSLGKATLNELLAHSHSFAAALAGRSQRWELAFDYYSGSVRLCRLDEAGILLWYPGWPQASV
jgi:hypothetical protein